MIDQFLTHLLFSPLVLGLFLFIIPKDQEKVVPWIALALSSFVFILSLGLLPAWDVTSSGMQFVEHVPWIPTFGIYYHLGIDGISLWLVLLTTLLTPLVILGSVRYITKSLRLYYFLFLALETTMVGTFLALDIFLFYVFWELMLFPMLLIIGIWGGPRKIYAALKFFLYTLVGSLLMLVGIFVLISLHKDQMGFYSTGILDLYKVNIPGGIGFFDMQSLLFMAFMFAFAIKVPIFPLHTWLPDAHVEAPTGGSVILAAVLLKMGTYAMLRFALPLFPHATQLFAPFMIALGIIGIIYGACVAMVQPDIKKLVAYSSVSHLGYCIMGIFVLNLTGMSGSLYQMLNHGISTGALFMIVGFLYERTHTREISNFGGLAKVAPMLTLVFMIITLSSIGLPTTNGFVGEFLILFGAYESSWVYAALGGVGVILGAIYMLWMYRRVCFGPLRHPERSEGSRHDTTGSFALRAQDDGGVTPQDGGAGTGKGERRTAHPFPSEMGLLLQDLTLREWIVIGPFVILVFVMGLASPYFMKYIEPSLELLLKTMHTKMGG